MPSRLVVLSTLWFAVEFWDFVDASLFFVALEKDMIAYRGLRSTYSACVIAESVVSFGFLNTLRRRKEGLENSLLYLPGWARFVM